jgi:benzodiazapine receptor
MDAIAPDGTSRKHALLALLGFGAATAAVAGLGSIAVSASVRSPWYARLQKPPFQPPRQAFGPVWTALYGLMAASAWRIWRAPSSPARTRALALWGGQLALNGAWSWIFFGARRPKNALVELTAMLATIAAYANEARKVDRTAAWLIAPYLAWTGFAGALNEEIVRRNL